MYFSLINYSQPAPITGYFFVHFSEGQFRPEACGALSFEGKNVSFLGKKYQFLSYKDFFTVQ